MFEAHSVLEEMPRSTPGTDSLSYLHVLVSLIQVLILCHICMFLFHLYLYNFFCKNRCYSSLYLFPEPKHLSSFSDLFVVQLNQIDSSPCWFYRLNFIC